MTNRYVPGPLDEYVVWYQDVRSSPDDRAWYIADQHGSTIAFTGNAGTGTARLRYDVTPVSHPAGTGVPSSSNAPNGR